MPFLQHPVDDLLDSLDNAIFAYDYGLPTHHPKELALMRRAVVDWLAKRAGAP